MSEEEIMDMLVMAYMKGYQTAEEMLEAKRPSADDVRQWLDLFLRGF